MTAAIRPLGDTEVEHVTWALLEAATLTFEGPAPPLDALLAHPDVARYHRDWGRPGDDGMVAELDGAVVGVAFCRLFGDGDHGQGYVDDRTPEVVVAVSEAHRGRGLGARLLVALADAARRSGAERLSLAVDADNPALRLYARLGYKELDRDDGVRMLLELV